MVLSFQAIKLTIGLRLSREEELRGADAVEHDIHYSVQIQEPITANHENSLHNAILGATEVTADVTRASLDIPRAVPGGRRGFSFRRRRRSSFGFSNGGTITVNENGGTIALNENGGTITLNENHLDDLSFIEQENHKHALETISGRVNPMQNGATRNEMQNKQQCNRQQSSKQESSVHNHRTDAHGYDNLGAICEESQTSNGNNTVNNGINTCNHNDANNDDHFRCPRTDC